MKQVSRVAGVVLLFGLAVSLASASSHDLKSLCRGENFKLRTMAQMRALSQELETAGDECDAGIKQAIRELTEMVSKKPGGVCSMTQAEAITNFVDSHLKGPAGREADSKLPEPLVKFALAYGMKVSRVCSHKMASEFPVEANRKFRILHPVWAPFKRPLFGQISESSPIGMLLDPILKAGELVLPADLMQAMPGLDQNVNLLVPKDSRWLRLKLLCENVLQPLYEPVLLPLARLNRAGFNNREWFWQRKLQNEATHWARVVFMCETFKMIAADPEKRPEVGQEEEAKIVAEMDKALETMNNNYGEKKREPKKAHNPDEDDESWAPENEIGNTIHGRFDFSMRSLVNNFDANKDHVDRIREQILNKSFRIVRKLFQKRGMGAAITEAVNNMRVKKGSEAELESAKQELVSLIKAPGGNSLGYNLLVALPRKLKDIIGCILLALLSVPAVILIFVVETEGDMDAYFEGLNTFSDNWLHIG